MPDSSSNRSAGVLLHPTSLPGPYGIGDLGPEACRWVYQLAQAKQTWWQILPLGPTGFGDSPYSCFSAFAGNPLLISPDRLVEDGLLDRREVEPVHLAPDRVNYGAVIETKNRWLARAWERFQSGAAPGLRDELETFRVANSSWLDDYALFMAIKQAQCGARWQDWPDDLRTRKRGALDSARSELAGLVAFQQFVQLLFFRQLNALRQYAVEKRVRLIGDVPIFVAPDSADVWANPHLFLLDEHCRPRVVAGVPPDYFMATGQS